jgi:hypothetical protein
MVWTENFIIHSKYRTFGGMVFFIADNKNSFKEIKKLFFFGRTIRIKNWIIDKFNRLYLLHIENPNFFIFRDNY